MMRQLASAQWDRRACEGIMHSYKATFSVVWRAGLRRPVKSIGSVFALERDFASLYTLWGELSQNQLTSTSVLSLPGETLKTN